MLIRAYTHRQGRNHAISSPTQTHTNSHTYEHTSTRPCPRLLISHRIRKTPRPSPTDDIIPATPHCSPQPLDWYSCSLHPWRSCDPFLPSLRSASQLPADMANSSCCWVCVNDAAVSIIDSHDSQRPVLLLLLFGAGVFSGGWGE
eukprot:GHVQ01022902.1.p1 GENE.GHVQ01022902.1~~GHVQ01022902.1.p1  ORF type:complete len:145 (-),score=17.72 GHVQ01022902.1:1055-1489(-)